MNSADSRDMVGSSDSRAAMASELIRWFSSYPHAIVAFSGGVDSAVVAYAAQAALGEAAFAVTGIGPAVSQRERQDAERVAERLGIQHVWLETQEIEDPDYQANLGRRCYYCKQHLYRSLQQWGMHRGWRYLFSGTNRDDLGDYRPGLQAAAEFQVLAPLVELDIGKQQVRQLAEYWSIPIADKPASPCLASRVAPGVRVDPKKLKAIELGEAWVREQGFTDVRLRWLAGDQLRVEVPLAEVERLVQLGLEALEDKLQGVPFASLVIDPRGLRSGNLNQLPIYGQAN